MSTIAETGRASPAGTPVPAADHTVWVVAGLTVLAAVLRFATLTHQSYWVDEASTVHQLSLPFGTMLSSVQSNETTPPLYFMAAWVWAKLFGSSEAGLRSLSALAGTAIVPVTWLAGRELVSRWAGVLAALFVAISPFMIWYSQEARSYMLFGLFCALSLWRWACVRRDPSPRNLTLWAVVSVLAVFTHFFAGLLVAPEALWLLYAVRARRAWIACGAIVIGQLAMLPLLLGDTGHALGWIKAFPLSTRIQQVPVDLGLSGLYQSSLVTDGLLGTALFASIVFAILVVGGGRREQRGALVAGGLAAVIVFVPFVLVAVGKDYIVPRNFIPAWVPLSIVLAAAATAPRARVAGAGLAVIVVGAFIYAGIRIDGNAAYQRPNWQRVARVLGPQTGPRAIYAFAGTFATEPLSVFMPRTAWSWFGTSRSPVPVTVTELDVIANVGEEPVSPLPAGVRLIAHDQVNTYAVYRFALSPAWRMSPAQLQNQAHAVMAPLSEPGAVLIQNAR